MTFTVRQLAEWVEGEVLGDGDLPITNARTLSDAESGDITFIDSDRHVNAWQASHASAAVAPPSVPANGRPLIRVADPLMAFVRIVQQIRGTTPEPSGVVDPSAHIHPTARIGEGATIGPFSVIGANTEIGKNATLQSGVVIGRDCRIGDDVVLRPRVVLYDGTVLGNRVVIHANTVIGADGFGYRFQNGRHTKVPQLGFVLIEDDVEIGAGSTIDRGTFGATRIGCGTKIDNLVMIGHNCQIGRHNVLAGQVGIAGSCTTGDYVVMAGQVGVADHLEVGQGAVLAARTGVVRPVPPGFRMLGYPARPESEAKRIWVVMDQLPEIRKELRRVKDHLGLKDS